MKIIESPRDGLQGLKKQIPIKVKTEYIKLMNIGFDTIDIGSFVSPSAIPQMSDTAEVLNQINLDNKKSKLMVLIANERGAKQASQFEQIDYIAFPFSISPTFLKRNINSDFDKSIKTINKIQKICIKNKKEQIVYIAMGFGNPYDDVWFLEILLKWIKKLSQIGINTIPLSDILGNASVERIELVFSTIIKEFPDIEFGFHLHTRPETYYEKVNTAYLNGCRRFDTVINGLGGCPMAADELLGNLDTNSLLNYCKKNNIKTDLNEMALSEAVKTAILNF